MTDRTYTVCMVLIICSVLPACAHQPAEPIVRIERVEVPVSRPCVPKETPERPVYLDGKDALKNAGAADQRYHLMTGEWFRKEARLNLLEGVVAACR